MKKSEWKLEEISAEILVNDLSSSDPKKRRKAETALISMGDSSICALEKILIESSLTLAKLRAISVLGKIGGEKAVFSILKVLSDKKVQVRNKAISILGEIKSHEAIPYLIEVLKMPDATTRNSAKSALRLMGERAIKPLLYSMLEGNVRLFQSGEDIILSLGHDVEDFLIEKLGERNNLLRALVIELLGKLKCKKAVKPVFHLLNSESSMVIKEAALLALGQIGDRSVLPEILEYTESELESFREKAIIALGEMGGASSVPYLKKLLKDTDEKVRLAVIESLGKLKDKSYMEELVNIAEGSSSEEEREKAVKSLSKIGDKESSEVFINKLRDSSPYVRLAAAEALGKLKSREAIPHLLKLACEDEHEFVRVRVEKIVEDYNF